MEAKKDWNCKQICKLAIDCKSKAFPDAATSCESDCTNLAADSNGRYARGAAMGAGFYSCANKTTDCDGFKACDK